MHATTGEQRRGRGRLVGVFFALFYVAIFGVPIAAAGFVVLAGVGREEIRARHLLVLGATAGAIVWGAVSVRRADGGTSYADFLRATAVVALLGAGAAAIRCVAQAGARRSAGPAVEASPPPGTSRR